MGSRDRGARVAGRNQFLETEPVEVEGEIPEEVALERVVAITENRLALEVLTVVLHLFFDVRQLRIELVLLRPAGIVQIGIVSHRANHQIK